MHLLSAMMGFALPNLIPRAYTHFASAVRFMAHLPSFSFSFSFHFFNNSRGISVQVLFVYFGIKLLRDSAEMSADGPSEELQEVEEVRSPRKTY